MRDVKNKAARGATVLDVALWPQAAAGVVGGGHCYLTPPIINCAALVHLFRLGLLQTAFLLEEEADLKVGNDFDMFVLGSFDDVWGAAGMVKMSMSD